MSSQKSLKKQIAQANLNTKHYLDESLDISKLPFLVVSPERARINRTSTINHINTKIDQSDLHRINESTIDNLGGHQGLSLSVMDITEYGCDQETTRYAFDNQLYTSPLLPCRKVDGSFNSWNSIENLTLQDESLSYATTSEQFYTVNGSFFDNEMPDSSDLKEAREVYVCCQVFHASQSNQLSLDVSDRVKLVYTRGDFCLVEHIENGRRGYVPKASISNVKQPWISNKCITL